MQIFPHNLRRKLKGKKCIQMSAMPIQLFLLCSCSRHSKVALTSNAWMSALQDSETLDCWLYVHPPQFSWFKFVSFIGWVIFHCQRRQWQPTPVLLPGKSHGPYQRSLVGCSPWVAKSRIWLNDFTFTFRFHAVEKEMATHSSVLAWRIPGMGEPGRLPSMGLHRVGHDWSDLAIFHCIYVSNLLYPFICWWTSRLFPCP